MRGKVKCDPFNTPNYDVAQRDALTEKLKADFLKSGQDFVYVGGKEHNENPLRVAQSNAQGWAGMPVELGVSNIYRNTQQFDGGHVNK